MWTDMLQALLEDYCQTETPYHAKLPFKTEQEVKAFQNKDQLINL